MSFFLFLYFYCRTIPPKLGESAELSLKKWGRLTCYAPGPGLSVPLRPGRFHRLGATVPRQGHPNIVRFLGLWSDPTTLESQVGVSLAEGFFKGRTWLNDVKWFVEV